MRSDYIENKIFILFLFLIFMLWAVLILFYFQIDKRIEKIENIIIYDMEVNNDKRD